MIKSKKQMFLVITIFTLVMMLGTVSYAFFNYTRTGSPNNFSVGRISFVSRNEETITINDLFPIDPSTPGIMNDTTKVGTYEIDIEGDTDYSYGLEYLVSTEDVHIYTSEGKTIPIGLNITVSNLGNESSTYFTSRNSKNATIYKRMSGNSIVGEQQLLVGYIKPNTESGTAEGVNGKITIKAYIDKNKISISNTYDGTESDDNGTTTDWVDGRVVITEEEWNALQSTGISFKIKVEANSGIWVNEPFYDVMQRSTVMDNINSTYVNNQTPGIDFSKISGDTDNDGIIDNGKGLYTRAGTENDAYPVIYYRGNVTNNNVYFGGKCWQIIRTTETGGIKMIYNGLNTGTEDEPACEPPTGNDRQITLNIDGTDINTFTFSKLGLDDSPTYSGYMQGELHNIINGDYEEESKFGNGITWNGTNYTITGVSETLDENHHYTCGTANSTTCSSIRYYYNYTVQQSSGRDYRLYYVLTDGKSIEDLLESMHENVSDSNAKSMVETWYEQNIHNNDYEDKIEDTVYCNDRSIYHLGGMDPNGGLLNDHIFYFGYARARDLLVPSTKCLKKNDSFTVSSSWGNGMLNYPVGMITIDEDILAGGVASSNVFNRSYYLHTSKNYWTMSPGVYTYFLVFFDLRSGGTVTTNTAGGLYGIRPVISLKHDTSILSGDGTPTNPYVIK